MRKLHSAFVRISVLVLFIVYVGCEEIIDDPFIVVSEDVLYVSSEQVRLVGRVLSIGRGSIINHGFEISLMETFSSSIKISLGEKTVSGRFIGESSNLQLNTIYFWRSYIEVGDELIFGQLKSFSTLSPGLTDFMPKIGRSGDQLFISGKNLSKDTEVYFGDLKVEIEELLFESQIRVRVPPISDAALKNITVRSQGDELTFEEPFEYIIGKWEKIGDFVNDLQLSESMYFYDDDSFIFGLGRDLNSGFNNKIWKLDLNSLQWGEIDYNGPALAGPFYTKGFFGSGATSFGFATIGIAGDFWNFEGSILTKKGNLPFRLYKSISFKIAEEIFVMGGLTSSQGSNNVIHRFNLNTQSWSIAGNSASGLSSDMATFTYSNSQYFMWPDGSIVRFNPQTIAWTPIANYPAGRFDPGGVSIVLNNKVYIGLDFGRDIWEFNPEDLSWKRKIGFTGSGNYANAGHFTHQGSVYILRRFLGPVTSSWPRMSLWKFEPDNW